VRRLFFQEIVRRHARRHDVSTRLGIITRARHGANNARTL
jgi:hypothetical protein